VHHRAQLALTERPAYRCLCRSSQRVVQEARRYLVSGAAVGEYLGDQLMLPMALAGAGSFSVEQVSRHARTDIISMFLPVSFRFEQRDRHAVCTVEWRA
jgi:RNA 3'-terminal phosphate cyclase (ATP)